MKGCLMEWEIRDQDSVSDETLWRTEFRAELV